MSVQAPLKVLVVGATGRMGRLAVASVLSDTACRLVGAVSRSTAGKALSQFVPGIEASDDILLESNFTAALAASKPDVVIELTHGDAAIDRAVEALKAGARPIVGATGMSTAAIERLSKEADKLSLGAMYIPNFAVGAALMMKFSQIAANWLSDVEIIEMHHEKKADAPSGTAKRTAEMISAGRSSAPTEKPKAIVSAEGALGGIVAGVPVHSVRLPGLVAHQMVIFGSMGETLTIRHDSTDRVGFMKGLMICVHKIAETKGLTIGLDAVMGI